MNWEDGDFVDVHWRGAPRPRNGFGESRHLRLLCLTFAAILVAGGVFVLCVGWLAGYEPVVRIRDLYPAMVPETALTLVLGGIGLALIWSPNARKSSRTVGLLMIVVTASGVFAPSSTDRFGHDDGMSLATAICGILAAISLIVWDTQRVSMWRSARIAAETLGLIVVMVSLIGYVMSAQALFDNPVFTKMAITTTAGFLMLFTGLLVSDTSFGWVQVLLAREPGSALLRRILPFVVLVPVILCAISVHTVAMNDDAVLRLSLLTFFVIVSVVMCAIFFTHHTNLSERRALNARAILLDSERARQAAELALSRSQKVEALGKLVGGVAHDFNNSLTVILGNLELISADDDRAARAAYVQEAINASNQAAHLTRQLLAYGRKSRLEALPNNIDDMAAATLGMFRRICPANIALHTDLNAPKAIVLLDGANFQQALLNILINARDAMPGGGDIYLSTRTNYLAAPSLDGYDEEHNLTSGTYVKLAVRDTGTGMDARTLARAEEPFFTTKPVGEGSGLGLSAVSGFCRQSGGGLKIESEYGVGTTVTMAFPQSSDMSDFAERKAPDASSEVTAARILVVDDEPSVTRVMARQLQLDGHVVRVAQSADQALTILEVEPLPELIITDLMMPGHIQGYRLAEIIHQKYPNTRVLLMSGYESERNRTEFARTQPIAFLQKPIDRATLRVAVAKALSGR